MQPSVVLDMDVGNRCQYNLGNERDAHKRCARQILLYEDDRTSNVCEIEYGKSCAKA
jgi:hypothetical protein